MVVIRLLMFGAGLLLAASTAFADPARWKREGWDKTDFSKTEVGWSEIMSGGPPKDGIPSIDKPRFKAASDAVELEQSFGSLADVEPVIGLELNGDARAYPLRILIWHEIVNDTVGGVPVAVTYCPLCNSSIVFDRRLGARVLTFGTTGKLRRSDLVMYDRQTQSWWQQFTGTAIVGELTGSELKLIPARLESFAQFKAHHPTGKVLVPTVPGFRPYGRNPYVGYDRAGRPLLYRGDLPKGIQPMARVVVVRQQRNTPVIVALAHLRRQTTIRLGTIELSWRAGQASAVDRGLIAKGRDVGTVAAVDVSAGAQPRPLPYDVTFAFVAHAFHPHIPIIQN